MADNRCSAYSFYVPLGDKSLNDFVEAQSNLSMTIRLLIKGFIYNCGGEYPDVSLMDLKDLIANASIDPERLAELAAQEKPRGRDRQKTVGIDRGDKADIVAEPGTPEVIDLDDDEIDEDGESKEPEDIAEDEPAEEAESAAAEPAKEEEISIGDDEEEDEAGEEAIEPESEPEPDPEPDPELMPEPEPKSTAPEKPEPKPAAKPAPKPATASLSGRAAYNQAQDEEEVGDIDDIMSLMGGM